MKKTLIAASIAALAAGSAQAVTLYESETGSFSTYGKIQLELQNADGENRIQNQGSRFGFSGESQVNEDLTAFANAEFRFNAGYQEDAEMDVRNSFVGVRGGFGSVRAGNFDSAVYTQVTAAADIMENVGFTSLDEGDNNARGFAIGYQTVDLNGLVVTANIRHYSSDDKVNALGRDDNGDLIDYPSQSKSGDQEWNIQVAVNYAISNELSIGFAFDQNNEDGAGGTNSSTAAAGNGKDPIFALGVNYATDLFGAFAVYEMNDKDWILNLGGNYSYGAGDIYGVVSVNYEDAPDEETGIDFALGANYNLASNFYVYGEFALGNDKVDRTVGDFAVVTLGANYNW